MNACVRCGVDTPETLITRGNTGPICRGCLNLYLEKHDKWRKFPNLPSSGSYGLISFNGESREGPFWLQILTGRKTQTIREIRADGKPHVVKGLNTNLYWKVREARQKPVHKIGVAKVIGYEEVKLFDLIFDEENAIADGFQDLDEFRLWFFPEWFDLHPQIKTHLEALRVANKEELAAVAVGIRDMGKTYGDTSILQQLIDLMKPMRKIKFELIEAAVKPVCSNCGYREYTNPQPGIIECKKCSTLLYADDVEWLSLSIQG